MVAVVVPSEEIRACATAATGAAETKEVANPPFPPSPPWAGCVMTWRLRRRLPRRRRRCRRGHWCRRRRRGRLSRTLKDADLIRLWDGYTAQRRA